MSDPTNQTERAQIDALIQAKKEEIKALEDLKETFTDDYEPESQTPAEVAQDPDVDSAERAAAANAVLGQDPVKVNAEQSEPSPSTHAEQFKEKSEEDKVEKSEPEETVAEDDKDKSKAEEKVSKDTKDTDKKASKVKKS